MNENERSQQEKSLMKESKSLDRMFMRSEQLSIRFGGNHAVESVSLELQAEKINAIVGPNGSGKSTFFNLISKVYTPTSGKIYFFNQDVTSLSDFELASPKHKNSISRTFQETPLFPYLTVREHLQLALRQDDQSFFSAFKKAKKENDEDLLKILATVSLDVSLDTSTSSLSYGQKKLLTFAVAVAKPHKALLIDEPVSGVNPRIRVAISKLLLEMKRKKETIVLIEHDMNFIFSIADHVAVMDSGKLIFQGTPQEVRENKAVLEAYMGS